MKALIPNSGVGSRMGGLTSNNPKCLISLGPETILERQIRILKNRGITEFIITTGPMAEMIKKHCQEKFPDLHFQFIPNERYLETNFMYSLSLTKEFIDDDFIYLHGDMAFEEELIAKLISSPHENTVLLNNQQELWEKDGKARINEGKVSEVSTSLFGDNCHNLNQVYKLSKKFILDWMQVMEKVLEENPKASANVALTEFLQDKKGELYPTYHQSELITEIDTPEDLEKWKILNSN